MEARLRDAKIIPTMLDGVAPSDQQVEMRVTFGDVSVDSGNLITPEDAANTPQVHIKAKPGVLYTLVSSDPDAPDPDNPIRGEFLHWIVANIKEGDIATGEELTPYVGPKPPIGTHRYAFMLLSHGEPIKAEDPSKGEYAGRACFKVRAWAKAHGLGAPVAVAWHNSCKTV